MNALQARMQNHELNPYMIFLLMSRHHKQAKESVDAGIVDPCGNGTVPRPIKTKYLHKIVNDSDHYAFSAVVDSVDTLCGTVPANQPTCSRVGSEERIATYIERHERGEALFHEADSNPIHDQEPPEWLK